MKLYSIETGYFKLDGGAMFGVVPKNIWQRYTTPDSENRVPLCMRSLLIEDGTRLILIDCGMGDKQSEKFFSHLAPFGKANLDASLAKHGFHRDDITDIFLTHLHFDHCGGAIQKNENGVYQPAFKNAIFWSHEKHWQWAVQPNVREKASFLTENILPIQESGQLKFIPTNKDGVIKSVPLNFDIYLVDGHTEAQMLPSLTYKNHKIFFCCDLIPTHAHIPLPYIPSYDVRPLLSMKEKEHFLEKVSREKTLLFSAHDPEKEIQTVTKNNGKFQLLESFKISDLS